MRFNLFESNWHEIEISTLIKEVNVKTSDFITYPLYSFTIEDGVTPKTDRYKRGFLVKKEGELFKIINNNNFIMNPMNLRFGAINFSRINKPVSVSGYYDIFTIDNCNYNHFWNAYFKNNKTLHRYNQIATGSLEEKKRVYFNQFIKMKFKVPNNDEKRKINELISLIEQRVLTQKKIIEYYLSFMKSIRDILLSAKANIKLGDICEVKKGTQLNSKDFDDNGIYPVINGGINISGYSNNYNSNNMITISEGGNSCGYVNYFKEKFWSGGHNYTLTKKINFNYDYLFHYLKYKENDIMLLRVGSGLPNIQKPSIINFLIYMPNIDIQNNITNILNSVLNKINHEKSILNLYVKEKEYLLNKLFI